MLCFRSKIGCVVVLLSVALCNGTDICPRWSEDGAEDAIMSNAPCTFRVRRGIGQFLFDMRPSCKSKGDYVSALNGDGEGNQYFANICANVSTANSCFPEDPSSSDYAHGAAIVFAEEKNPPCNKSNPGCVDPVSGKKVCCTRSCQALGLSTPKWELLYSSDPWRGGTRAVFPAQLFEGSNRFCGSDRATEFPWRQLVFNITCAYGSTVTKFVGVERRGTQQVIDGSFQNVCIENIEFSSPQACSLTRISIGWIAISLLLLFALAYVAVGVVSTFAATGVLAYPNRRWWSTQFADVRLGWRITKKALRGDFRHCPCIEHGLRRRSHNIPLGDSPLYSPRPAPLASFD